MQNIGLKQKNLIKKVKKYFNQLESKNIDVSKSSFCYIPSYGLNPGNTKLVSWAYNKFFNFQNIRIILFNILAISSYHNYELCNVKQKNYTNIFISWGKKKDFKKKIFSDKLLNANSKTQKNSLFFVIYTDNTKPSFIPKNVILFKKKNIGRSITFLIKQFLKSLLIYNFNLKKLFHYFSSQTVFAERINDCLQEIINKLATNKIL